MFGSGTIMDKSWAVLWGLATIWFIVLYISVRSAVNLQLSSDSHHGSDTTMLVMPVRLFMLMEIHAKQLFGFKVLCVEEHRWPKKAFLAMPVQGPGFTWQIYMDPFIVIDKRM